MMITCEEGGRGGRRRKKRGKEVEH